MQSRRSGCAARPLNERQRDPPMRAGCDGIKERRVAQGNGNAVHLHAEIGRSRRCSSSRPPARGPDRPPLRTGQALEIPAWPRLSRQPKDLEDGRSASHPNRCWPRMLPRLRKRWSLPNEDAQRNNAGNYPDRVQSSIKAPNRPCSGSDCADPCRSMHSWQRYSTTGPRRWHSPAASSIFHRVQTACPPCTSFRPDLPRRCRSRPGRSPGGNLERVGRFMRRHHDGQPTFGGEPLQHRQHHRLIAEIQRRGRLVEKQDVGLRRQRAGHQCELALAARQRGDGSFRQCAQADQVEGLHGARGPILRGRVGEQSDMPRTPISTISKTE